MSKRLRSHSDQELVQLLWDQLRHREKKFGSIDFDRVDIPLLYETADFDRNLSVGLFMKVVQGLTIVKPIVYGNVARYFGKKREEDGHTHQWTVYVKPYENEDLSAYVKKVHFKLHESYVNPNRIVTKPPYELTETGWGEFEIVIKIYFHDPNERPVTLYHILKLFQSPVAEGAPPTVGRALVSESYEEIVFQEPTQLMQHLLSNAKPITNGVWKHDTDFEDRKEKTLEKIIAAQTKVRSEISELKEKLSLAKETITKFKEEIAKLQSHNNVAGI